MLSQTSMAPPWHQHHVLHFNRSELNNTSSLLQSSHCTVMKIVIKSQMTKPICPTVLQPQQITYSNTFTHVNQELQFLLTSPSLYMLVNLHFRTRYISPVLTFMPAAAAGPPGSTAWMWQGLLPRTTKPQPTASPTIWGTTRTHVDITWHLAIFYTHGLVFKPHQNVHLLKCVVVASKWIFVVRLSPSYTVPTMSITNIHTLQPCL